MWSLHSPSVLRAKARCARAAARRANHESRVIESQSFRNTFHDPTETENTRFQHGRLRLPTASSLAAAVRLLRV